MATFGRGWLICPAKVAPLPISWRLFAGAQHLMAQTARLVVLSQELWSAQPRRPISFVAFAAHKTTRLLLAQTWRVSETNESSRYTNDIGKANLGTWTDEHHSL